MASLTYTLNSALHGGPITSRVLIGRRLSHGVVLTDTSVSRLHAWIDPWIDPIEDPDAQWAISDAGSTTGTFVNDQKVVTQPLHDGDKIRVGNVTVTYHVTDRLPKDAIPVELSSPTGKVKAAGILFECACGAPLWVGNELAGKRGMCRHCRKPVTVPPADPSTVAETKPVARSKPAAEQKPAPEPILKPPSKPRVTRCAVCHSTIAADEPATQCPDCAMNFHTECWQENLGCSSYGCPQVDALKPQEEEPASPVQSTAEVTGEPLDPPHRWDVVLLAASVIGAAIACVTFGFTALVIELLATALLLRGRQKQPILLLLAMAISMCGIVAGLGVSDFWYFNGRHLPTVFMHH
jgi:pSer/pThr/pTyr-binding forkhead associated (FHA) protein